MLGYGGERFIQAYRNNRNQSNDEAITSHPVASAVVALMKNNQTWSGSVASLLGELEHVAQREKINTLVKNFPKAAHILSKRLKEVKSNLEEIGISFEIRHNGENKKISIKKAGSNLLHLPTDNVKGYPRKRPAPNHKQENYLQELFAQELDEDDTIDNIS